MLYSTTRCIQDRNNSSSAHQRQSNVNHIPYADTPTVMRAFSYDSINIYHNIGKGKGWVLAYTSRDQQRFTISEVAADRHEIMTIIAVF